jgi:hypothetical protein
VNLHLAKVKRLNNRVMLVEDQLKALRAPTEFGAPFADP